MRREDIVSVIQAFLIQNRGGFVKNLLGGLKNDETWAAAELLLAELEAECIVPVSLPSPADGHALKIEDIDPNGIKGYTVVDGVVSYWRLEEQIENGQPTGTYRKRQITEQEYEAPS